MILPRRRSFILGRKLLIVRKVAVSFPSIDAPSLFARILNWAGGSKAPS